MTLALSQPLTKNTTLFRMRGQNITKGVENHGGSPPSNWLVHDQLGDITLGSWFGTGQVLCAV